MEGVEDIDAGWRFVSIGFEGQPTDIGGYDPWKADWMSTHSRITVAHPSYPDQRHPMFTYEIAGSNPPVTFAAGEFSNGVWGFFVPIDEDTHHASTGQVVRGT
jgi:hypothetical protein